MERFAAIEAPMFERCYRHEVHTSGVTFVAFTQE